MSGTTLIWFWVLWLLDVLAALFGFREFMNGAFGRYAITSSKYITLWVSLLTAILLILTGSLYFKNHALPLQAMIVAAIPLVLATPYALFMLAIMTGGKNRWN